MSPREPGQGLVSRGRRRWRQAGGVLGEHKSAADDYPAIGKGQGRTGPGRKEAKCLGEHRQIANAHLRQLRGETLETRDRRGGIFPGEKNWGLVTGRPTRRGPTGCLWSLPFTSLQYSRVPGAGGEGVFTHSGPLAWLERRCICMI